MDGKEIYLYLGWNSIFVDGVSITIDVPAQTLNDRTVIPLRAVAESLGKTVFWDPKGLIVISDGYVLGGGDTETINTLLGMLK